MTQQGIASRLTAQRVASAIYGLIITGAVLAGVSAAESRRAVILEVLAVVVIYWMTEQYAEYLGRRLTEGHPGWSDVLADLRGTLTMIEATLIPVAVLVIAELAGASLANAVTLSLVSTVVTLAILITALSRAARISWYGAIVSGLVAGFTGSALVLLKAAALH